MITELKYRSAKRDGPAMTIIGKSIVDPNVFDAQTIGRWWTADYVGQWTSLQTALANRYDGNALVYGICQTAAMSASDEPFVPFLTNAPESSAANADKVNQVLTTQQAGFTDAAQILTLRAAIADYAQWSTTPLDYTFNPFTVLDGFVSNASGTNEPPLNDNITLAVLQQARNSTRMVQAGARPMTSMQYLLELQRDWARTETYDLATGIAKTNGGAYGLGVIYAKTMFGGHEA